MDGEEFERDYCEQKHITTEEYRRWFVTMPCACDYEGCQGWAAIRNDPYFIADQKEFYSPKEVSRGET